MRQRALRLRARTLPIVQPPRGHADHAGARIPPEDRHVSDDDRASLPPNWADLWGPAPPDRLANKQLRRLRLLVEELAAQVPMEDRSKDFASLVGAGDLRRAPVHRWFTYKEGFSPNLPARVLDLLGRGRGLVVADPFGGVATTALALRADPRVVEIRSVEYSPLAHFVGNAKLAWPELDPDEIEVEIPRLLRYRVNNNAAAPGLAALRNRRIFDPAAVASLQAARNTILRHDGLSERTRAFFLTGLAAVIEDASKAMKDGRALRILRSRSRTPTSLSPAAPIGTRLRDPVKRLLHRQWRAMAEDLRASASLSAVAASTAACHLRGDARNLRRVRHTGSRVRTFPDSSIDVAIFSPPYLNFIDYSEVYKLELWLMGHVTSQAEFRRLRLGTLRSHPSIRFGDRRAPKPADDPAIDLIHRMSGWFMEHGTRPESGRVVRQYFEDMWDVFAEQARVMKPGGTAVCVVANSTFSRREKEGGETRELWRVPLLTDVLLAHIARLTGFSEVELWRARDLRPRNVRRGAARESLVVARI